ncbi:MAG: amidase [Vicinamibacteria bacterium]|nr:amidase [Vicinamibacteria bacterium]
MAERRAFLKLSLAASSALAAQAPEAAAAEAAAINDFPLEELTLDQAQKAMAAGDLTAEDLAEAYLERIGALNARGPELRHVIEINPSALAIAAALDEERAKKGARGPLHGVPVLIKDNIDTGDKMQTTAGSLALEGHVAARDAHVAERLRAAGAVILGKTNLSEWANFRSSRSISGWSGRGGQARNPYALDRNTSGSSSGSGGGVSANLCLVAVGTETDGSIVSPAAINGIVGIKPTLGRVSRRGIIPIAASQDTAGPMARTVKDAAWLLFAMCGIDESDPATAASRGHVYDLTGAFDADGLKGARLGVVREMAGFHRRVDHLFEAALGELKKAGAVLVDVEMPTLKEVGKHEFEVLLYEFKDGLNAYLKAAGPGAKVRSLADVIAFNEAEAERELRYFGHETLIAAEAKGPLTEQPYLDALAACRRLTRDEGLDAALAKHQLDGFVAPTDSAAWPIDPVNGDHYLGGSSTAAAVAGYPHVTVPMGAVFGLPVGLSFFGAAWSDAKLIRYAYAFEQATHHRFVPRLRPSVDLAGRTTSR